MSILSDARIKVEYLEDYYRRREAGYHPECEPLAVSEAAAMLPEVVAYAERREAQAIHERAEHLRDNEITNYGILSSENVDDYLAQAAKELDADLSSWHKITEDEKAAIQYAIETLRDRAYYEDEPNRECIEKANVLRGMIS